MASDFFRFKQFTIWHDKCGMKVGTDGVLLGAWIDTKAEAKRILDIGTGSGLIAIMLAQRCEAEIDAIDIDQSAVEQAKGNADKCPWSSRIHIYQSSLQDWAQTKGNETIDKERKYDLIVSNPPYFQNSLKNPNKNREMARHTDTLSYRELILNSAELLATNGRIGLILPAEAEQDIAQLCAEYGLKISRLCHVYSKEGKSIKRILIEAVKSAEKITDVHAETFYIEGKESPRSEEYARITQDFYL